MMSEISHIVQIVWAAFVCLLIPTLFVAYVLARLREWGAGRDDKYYHDVERLLKREQADGPRDPELGVFTRGGNDLFSGRVRRP